MRKTTEPQEARKRTRRSRSEWQLEIARWQRSGLSGAAYAQRHELSASTLYWWSTHLRQAEEAPSVSFLPVRVQPAASVETTPFSLEVTLRNGRTVRARGDVDAARLARVLDALEGGAE